MNGARKMTGKMNKVIRLGAAANPKNVSSMPGKKYFHNIML